MAEPKSVAVPTPLVQAVVNYLVQRPYGEVVDLLNALGAAAETHRDALIQAQVEKETEPET